MLTDLLTEHARTILLVSRKISFDQIDDWYVHVYEILNNVFTLTGAIAPILKSGKNKGKRNWKKRDRSTEFTIEFTIEDHLDWESMYLYNLKLCRQCKGFGYVFVGGKIKFQKCQECHGTGKDSC